VAGGNGIAGATVGVPFPLPQNGLEVLWNSLTRFRGVAATRYIDQAAVERGGGFQLVKFEDEFLFNYTRPDITTKELESSNTLIYFKQAVTAPARLAGTILLAQETMDQVKEPRRAWVYNAGRRRVTRAPNVAYDNPGTAADGQRTSDQFDMFNGAPDRYEWTLVGKKEMLVPYNSYKLHAKGVKVGEILKPNHINPDLTRHELHRVWVVDAKVQQVNEVIPLRDIDVQRVRRLPGGQVHLIGQVKQRSPVLPSPAHQVDRPQQRRGNVLGRVNCATARRIPHVGPGRRRHFQGLANALDVGVG
jgi:hypothetical protein